jgi:hypothetical protein
VYATPASQDNWEVLTQRVLPTHTYTAQTRTTQASARRVPLIANQNLNHLLLLLASACQDMEALLEVILHHARLVDLVITEQVQTPRVNNALFPQ